ncbi:unnamed protein product, partial [Nesidiocoris tenuis]
MESFMLSTALQSLKQEANLIILMGRETYRIEGSPIHCLPSQKVDPVLSSGNHKIYRSGVITSMDYYAAYTVYKEFNLIPSTWR